MIKYKLNKNLNMLEFVNIDNFSLKNTLNCGQCFRWDENVDGSFTGVASGRCAQIWQENDHLFIKENNMPINKNFWYEYFDLDRDYESIKVKLFRNPILKESYEFSPGIRIIKQDAWEVLISFIVSQNNNIKRIRGIISKLCKLAGNKICDNVYEFPAPSQLEIMSLEQLASTKVGFRAKYILDATKVVCFGIIDLDGMKNKRTNLIEDELMLINGVGPKVAACVILYGLGRVDVAPIDVWIKRGLCEHFSGTWPIEIEGIEGIAQQYLYNYIRASYKLK